MRRFTTVLLILLLVGVSLLVVAPQVQAQTAWQPNTAYSVGQLVTYGGSVYKCIQAHTSQVGWEPPNVPALWALQTGTVAPTIAPSKTNTPVNTATSTATLPCACSTPTITPTVMKTNTPIPTATKTNTPVVTSTFTKTAVPPTATNTTIPSATPTSGGTTAPAWDCNLSYSSGTLVSYQGHIYKALVAVPAGECGWIPGSTPTVWGDQGTGTSASSTPTLIPTNGPSATNTATFVPTTVTPTTATATATSGGTATCAVKSAPTGKVLAGYWESWDGAINGVHPGMGWIPIGQVPAGYNVIDAAFPVILSDGTAEWFSGMDTNVKVPSPQEICDAKAAGHWVLLSIGGATAAVDLSSATPVDKFISTIVPILKNNNFDGIDIDIESGLVAGSSFTSLSTSQANLERLIDGVLAQMPSNFMLTMAPETAYVTGGQVALGGPWGAYDPIIVKYLNSGRLSWLQMQYYNGSMYGCNPPGVGLSAGTVAGFVQQTQCMESGFVVAGTTVTISAGKIVVGLPAQPGAGGGYMVPADVSTAYSQVSSIKGLMTWSINWDGSKGWTFLNTKPF